MEDAAMEEKSKIESEIRTTTWLRDSLLGAVAMAAIFIAAGKITQTGPEHIILSTGNRDIQKALESGVSKEELRHAFKYSAWEIAEKLRAEHAAAQIVVKCKTEPMLPDKRTACLATFVAPSDN